MFVPFSCSVGERIRAQIIAENTVNEEDLNSQSSQLEEEDVRKLEADSVPLE